MDDPIVKKFCQTTLYQKTIQDPNCVCVFIGGSRLGDLNTSSSDYDINFVYAQLSPVVHYDSFNSQYTQTSCFVEIDGFLLHWYRQTWGELIGNILSNKPRHFQVLALFGKFNDFSREKIIYINPQYKNLMQFVESKKFFIQEIALYRYFERYLDLLGSPERRHALSIYFNINLHPKFYYNVYHMSLILLSLPVDRPFIRILKDLDYNNKNEFLERSSSKIFMILQQAYLVLRKKYPTGINSIVENLVTQVQDLSNI